MSVAAITALPFGDMFGQSLGLGAGIGGSFYILK